MNRVSGLSLKTVALVSTLTAGCALHPASPPTVVEYQIQELIRSPEGPPPVRIEGHPSLMTAGPGRVVAFDGKSDRLVVLENPLAGAEEFTIEVLLAAGDVYPDSPEPRFLHLESASQPDRRLTMELRLTPHHQWYLDAFIKSEVDRRVLIDPGKLHPTGEWHHVAMVYEKGNLATFVNGVSELQGGVDYRPIPGDAVLSIGARLNQIHWFAGQIAWVRVTHQALEPLAFRGIPGASP